MRSVLSSLRLRVLAVMLVPAALLIVGAFLIFSHVSSVSERNSSFQSDQKAAEAVAQAATKDPVGVEFGAFQTIIGDDQISVTYHGRLLFRGPANTDPAKFRIIRHFPGGEVTVIGDVDGTTVLSLQLTAIAAGLLVLLAVVALLGTTTLIRGIREPLERAAAVADHLAGGDLKARMGPGGPDQFRRLGRAFDTMADRLEASDRDQQQFLSDLAHEIATPVTAVIGLAGAALDHTISTPAQEQEALDLLDGETTRLRGLLDDLRRLRTLELPTSVDREHFDLGALCEALGRLFDAPARAAHLELRVRAPNVDVVSDPRFVERILTNFLTNAIRYTPAGGLVELTAAVSHDTVAVAVADNGMGIPPDEHDRIFDRFHRVDAARDRVSGGTGLGLAIARRAAVALGGRIELDSALGQGSTFRLVLPLGTAIPVTASHDRSGQAEPDGSDGPPRAAVDPLTPVAGSQSDVSETGS
jgi:two-component system sensor histidine kinase BaeS